MSLKRYEIQATEEDSLDEYNEVEWPFGDWVKYEDAQVLEASHAELLEAAKNSRRFRDSKGKAAAVEAYDLLDDAIANAEGRDDES